MKCIKKTVSIICCLAMLLTFAVACSRDDAVDHENTTKAPSADSGSVYLIGNLHFSQGDDVTTIQHGEAALVISKIKEIAAKHEG